MEGLDIDLKTFKKMPSVDRDAIMYRNVLDLKKDTSDYKFHKKVNYAWLSTLTAAILFLGRLIINNGR